MNNILTAVYGQFSGSSLSSDVGGRMYLDAAPDGTQFPYIVYFIISAYPDNTFSEHFTDSLIQFSLFSASPGATEITTMYKDLISLYDDKTFSITANTLVWMREDNVATMVEDTVVRDASVRVKHWAVDFELKTSLV